MDDHFDPDLAALFDRAPQLGDADAFARGVDRRIGREQGLRAAVVLILALFGAGAALAAAGFGRHPEAVISAVDAGLAGWLTSLAQTFTVGGADRILWLWLLVAAAAVATLVADRFVEEA